MICVKKGKLVCAAAAALLFASCGASGTSEPLPSVTLSVWCPYEETDLTSQMVSAFSEVHKDVASFNITISAEGEQTCKDTVLSSPENAADVFSFAADQFEPLRRGGALLPVTENADEIITANGGKDNGSILGASFDGTLFAYPETASNGYFLYYNSAYYTEEDVKSFDRLLEIAEENGKKVYMDFSSGWYIYSFFKGAGLSVDMNEDGVTNSCDWNSQTAPIRGLDIAEAMLKIASNKGFVSGSDDDFKAGVKDGSIIAGVNGTWNSSVVSEAWGEDFAAAKLPEYTVCGRQVQMHSFAGYKYVGVNANTKEPHWAMELARWLTNEENQTARFNARGECPSNIKAADSPEVKASPALAALSEQSAYGHLQNVADTFWTPAYAFGTVIISGNSDGRDLRELLDEMTEGITAPPAEK